MQKSSQQSQQDTLDEFKPNSFVVFCLDQAGDIGFEASWGDSINDVKKFATLISKVVNGDFNDLILSQLKEQSSSISNGTKKYATFEKIVKNKTKTDLVINPVDVEIIP